MTQSGKFITGDGAFIRRCLIVIAIGGLVFLLWQMRTLLLLLFGALLVSVIFRSIADPIRHFTKLPEKLSVAFSVLLVIGGIAAASWMFGSEVSSQMRMLTDTVPEAWNAIQNRMSESPLGERVRDMLQEATPSGSGVIAGMSQFVLSLGAAVADTLVVIVGGIYLAAQPRLYRAGILKLVPANRRTLAGETITSSERALRLWLKGQLISMVVVGLMVGAGLWFLDVPSGLALALLAMLLEFIPLVGPIIAAIPAILIAFAYDPQLALWVLGLYVVVQQIEGNILQPMVQQYAVDLPAVILLFALLGFGTLFGALGILLAAPLTVVIYVMVKRLYVREALNTPTTVPGEKND